MAWLYCSNALTPLPCGFCPIPQAARLPTKQRVLRSMILRCKRPVGRRLALQTERQDVLQTLCAAVDEAQG